MARQRVLLNGRPAGARDGKRQRERGESQLKKALLITSGAIVVLGVLARAGMLRQLFSANYVPHRYCYLAQPGLVWTNVVMDALIAASYGLIFGCLFWITGQLRTLKPMRDYLWIFLAFGTFIVACGATHIMEVVTVWWPIYPLAAAVKVVCAAASVPTAILFARVSPVLAANISRFLHMLSTTQQEKDQALAALIASEKLAVAGLISATLAHEIRNPLETIVGQLYLLKTGPRTPEDLDEHMANMSSAVERLDQIVANTLSLFQPDRRLVPIELCQVVKDVLEHEGMLVRTKNIFLLPRLRPGAPLKSNRVEVCQILTNLLQNAAAAIGKDGTIAVRVQPRHRLVGDTPRTGSGESPRRRGLGQPGYSITIADTGAGIDPASRAKLFTLFFTTKGKQGTGLGLWLVRSMVERHGGRITFRSRTAAESSRPGTIFNLWLPLEPALAADPSVADGEAA